MNYEDIDIILNIFYAPTEQLKEFIQENFRRNEHPYLPINGGSSLKSDSWCKEYLRFDDEGDNISNLNPLLNEMTSIYWYWKNIKNDCSYVGFNHYRRFFNLNDIEDYHDYDMIVSKPIWSSNQISLAYQYKHYHVLQDLQTCIDVIRNDFNYDWGEGFRKYLLTSGTNLAPCNMFVMKKELFYEWCDFIFPILFKLKDVICTSSEFQARDNYQKRALCFLTERMFNYWYYLKKSSGLKCKEIDMDEKLEYKPVGVNERGDFSRPQLKVALVAIAKNEDNYLKEWVDYHLNIGFTDIFIFQNNWRYPRHDISDSRVHFIEFDGHRMQMPCYNGFILDYWDKYDFAAFFDIDEFLYIKDNSKITDKLVDYVDVDSIYVNWRLFGDSNLSYAQDDNYSVINRFTRCDSKLYRLGKHIVNLKKNGKTVLFANPHILRTASGQVHEVSGVDPNRKLKTCMGSIANNSEDEAIELYHYRNKTWQETIERRYGQDDVFHEASETDFCTDITAVKREFNNHNKNTVFNFNLVTRTFGKKMKTLLCCIAKDEDQYINEWIEYNLKIGFDKIAVFQNNWRANIDKRFRDRVILIPFDSTDPFTQQTAYNTCIDIFSGAFDWIAFFDVDEFLVLKSADNLNSWLDRYSRFDAVGVNWLYFGSNGHEKIEGDNFSVIRRFTKSDTKLDEHIKTILNTAKCRNSVKMHVCCHCTIKSFNENSTVAVDGKNFIHSYSNTANLSECMETAYLAHFRCKSKQEWDEKCTKNGNGIQKLMSEYHDGRDKCFIESDKNLIVNNSLVNLMDR